MERGRIAEVHAGAYGTGYLVAPDLVLTAGHVIANQAAIVVRFLDSSSAHSATLAWHDADLDVALLRVDRALPAVRWGRLVSSSRIARELTHLMVNEGWAVGHVADGVSVATVEIQLARLTAPVLFVIDYAETRPELVGDLVSAMAKQRGRILLIARTAGDWWEELVTESARELRDILRTAPVGEVRRMSLSERASLFDNAMHDLGAQLTGSWPEPVEPPDLSPERYGSPLLIGMMALARLLSPEQPTDLAGAADIILDHEAPYWSSVAQRYGIALHQRDQRKVVAAFSLCGAANEAEALALLSVLPGFTDESDAAHERRQRAVSWIRDLYPATRPESGAGFCGSLQPDLLAEHLVGEVVRANPGFVASTLHAPSREQLSTALIVLSRAASHQAHLAASIDELIDARPEHAVCAIQTAPELADPQPIVDALLSIVSVIPKTAESLPRILELHKALPLRTRCLNQVALLIGEALVSVRREQAIEGDVNAHSLLAVALNAVSARFAAAGRLADGIDAVEEAVDIYRELSMRSTHGWRGELATTLNNLSVQLGEAGRQDEALRAMDEAIRMQRELTEPDSDRALFRLSVLLNNWSVRLAEANRQDEALLASAEAVDMSRRLVADGHEYVLSELGTQLNNHSLNLMSVRQSEAGLKAVTESVDVWRRLVEAEPDSWLPNLAAALHNLAVNYVSNERYDDALDAMQEAVELRRRLSEQVPARYASELVQSEAVLDELRTLTTSPLLLEFLRFFRLVESGVGSLRPPAMWVLRIAHRTAPRLLEELWQLVTGKPLPPDITGQNE